MTLDYSTLLLLVLLAGIASYTYLNQMKMRITSQLISSLTVVVLTHSRGDATSHDIEMGMKIY